MKIKMTMVMLVALMSACGSAGTSASVVQQGPQPKKTELLQTIEASVGRCEFPKECEVYAAVIHTIAVDTNGSYDLFGNLFMQGIAEGHDISFVNDLTDDIKKDFAAKTDATVTMLSKEVLGLSDMADLHVIEKVVSGEGVVNLFSRVGFNHAADVAVVELSYICILDHADYCGGGNLIILKKNRGNWVIQSMQGSWNS